MKPFRPILLGATLALLSFATAAAQSELQMQNRVRVMTYNIHNGIGMDGCRDVVRLADVMRRSGADVVAVQEVDSMTQRSGGRYVLGELAAEGLFYPTFAPAMDYDGGKYGVGLLSRERPLAVRRIPLPGSEEPRVLLVAEFERYVVGCMHLSLTASDRMASLAPIREAAAGYAKPFFLAGDWNDLPDSEFITRLSEDFRIVTPREATCPADEPEECLDYVALYRPTGDDWVTMGGSVLPEKVASDHRPVTVTLQCKLPAGQRLYREPYLQNPTPEGITVMFQTNALCHAWVEYGTDTLRLTRTRELAAGQEPCHDIEHRVRLTGLQPGATYYYRLQIREIVSYRAYSKEFGHTLTTPFRTFTLPAPKVSSFTALVLNDLHEDSPTIEAMSRLARRIPHDFVIFNGDCLPEARDRAHAMRQLHLLTDAFDGASTPLFFVRGNHEIRNAYSSGMLSLLDNPGGKTYGAFSWGGTRFVVLDCGEDKPDDHWAYSGLNDFTEFRREQAEFLRREFASEAFQNADYRLLIHHIPLWGMPDEPFNPCRELWGDLLRNREISAAICGHTHEYRWLGEGEEESPFDVLIGGGPGVEHATMTVVEQQGLCLTLRVLDADGCELNEMTIITMYDSFGSDGD